jgi:Myotubularin-like phosphatase domain
MVLVEKDFLSFGYMFAKRSGHLSNEKFFIDNYVQQTPPQSVDSPPTSGRASPSIPFSATIAHSSPSPPAFAAAAARGAFSNMASRISLKPASKPPQMKETSPVFHQFLDAVYQILHIQPNRFEFNERFLRRLLYHAYSCQYGSFLYDSEKDRVESKVRKKTRCVWDYFLARRKEFINAEFDRDLDKGEGVLFPKGDNVRWWAQAWGRRDEEMNGPGRGTNFRDDNNTVKPREEGKAKEEKASDREPLNVRMEKAMRSASPRKESPPFDGVGASPVRANTEGSGATSRENSPTRVRSNLQTEVSVDHEPFVEVDPAAGKPDPVTEENAEACLELETKEQDGEGEGEQVDGEDSNVVAIESSDEFSLGGSASVISSAVEDNGLSEYVTPVESEVELDPLGGGIEMKAFTASSTTLRNR